MQRAPDRIASLVRAATILTSTLAPVTASASEGSGVPQAAYCRAADGKGWLAPSERSGNPGCSLVSLPVPLAEVRWVHWLPQPLPNSAAAVVLEGARKNGAFHPATARFAKPPARPERPPILPLGASMLAQARLGSFGLEERVSVARAGSEVLISCRAGSRPAGAIIEPAGQRFPRGAEIALEIRSTGDAGLRIGLAARGDTPGVLVEVNAGRASLAVPDDGRVRDNPALVAVCPAGAASFRVAALSLVPTRGPPAVARSAWAWKPGLWRTEPQALLSAAERHAIGRLFVSVEIANDRLKHEAEFASFVTMARSRGVAVMPVEGDPAMALPEGRTMAVRRLRVLAAYQDRAAPEARLAGVQYDIEPYLLPSYAADPEPILSGWAETLRALKEAAGDLPLDLALPFWLPEDEAAERLVLPAVEAVASSVTAMAYRTNADALQQAAEPLLAWGAARGRLVHVALEAGPLDDEVTRRYREAPGGELLAVPHESGSLLLVTTASGPARGGRSFVLERETVAAAGNVSFLGGLAQMNAVAEQAVPSLAAWPTFGGLAFHGLLE